MKLNEAAIPQEVVNGIHKSLGMPIEVFDSDNSGENNEEEVMPNGDEEKSWVTCSDHTHENFSDDEIQIANSDAEEHLDDDDDDEELASPANEGEENAQNETQADPAKKVDHLYAINGDYSVDEAGLAASIGETSELATVEMVEVVMKTPETSTLPAVNFRKRRHSQIDFATNSSSGMSSDNNLSSNSDNMIEDDGISSNLEESDDAGEAIQSPTKQPRSTSTPVKAQISTINQQGKAVATTQTSIFDTIPLPPNPYYHRGANVFIRRYDNNECFTSVTKPANMRSLLDKLWKWDCMPKCSAKFECPECGHFIMSYYDNREHFLVKHLGKRHVCHYPMCNRLFESSKPTVRYHMMRHNWATIEEMKQNTEGRDFIYFDPAAGY